MFNEGSVGRVTITEISNENLEEDVDENIMEEETTDGIFTILDDIVKDWKVKLEVAVGDGLKNIKKASRERKTMMKYLPGDGIKEGAHVLAKAKEEMIKEWKIEVGRAIQDTHNNLHDLGCKQVKNIGVSVTTSVETKEKDKVDNIKDDKTINAHKVVPNAAFHDLKKMMKELDIIYQNYSSGEMHFNKVPIYSVANGSDKYHPRTSSLPFPRWRSMCTLTQMTDSSGQSPLTVMDKDRELVDILQDFVSDQAPYKSLVKEWYDKHQKKPMAVNRVKREIKKPRRGSNSILRMKERKEQKMRKQFELKEFETKGQKHYLVVKKEFQDVKDEVEDIFSDWRKNYAAIKRPRSIKNRVRKISHRQERKEFLKQAEQENIEMGPLTYSQMLKKGLALPKEQEVVEDIFESWRKQLDYLTDMVFSNEDNPNQIDELDIFKVWKHNLHVPVEHTEDVDILNTTHPTLLPNLDCGQPTVKKVIIKKKRNTKEPRDIEGKKSKTLEPTNKPVDDVHETKKTEVKTEILPKSIPIPPPPPPPQKKPDIALESPKYVAPNLTKEPVVKPPPQPKTNPHVSVSQKQVVPVDDVHETRRSTRALVRFDCSGPYSLETKKPEVKTGILPKSIPIPPPPPPPQKKSDIALESPKYVAPNLTKEPVVKPPPQPKTNQHASVSQKQVVLFEEKKTFVIPTPPPMPVINAAIPSPRSSSTVIALMPPVKPILNSQSYTDKETLEKTATLINIDRYSHHKESKFQPTAEQIYEFAKESSSNKPTWQALLLPNPEASGRGEAKIKMSSRPEEIFQSWRYIFTEENSSKYLQKDKCEPDLEMIFKEWADTNLEEPEVRKPTMSETSPRSTKKETRKQIKSENIEDDMIEIKENRRHDFARNASIKDKKRGDAFRKSTGKKIK